MYKFISLDKIISFFASYGINISALSSYELSVLIILSNIAIILSYMFIFYITYKIILRVLDWWF